MLCNMTEECEMQNKGHAPTSPAGRECMLAAAGTTDHNRSRHAASHEEGAARSHPWLVRQNVLPQFNVAREMI
jgi:hypothetical protein